MANSTAGMKRERDSDVHDSYIEVGIDSDNSFRALRLTISDVFDGGNR